jgi:hypothetical protein
MPMPDEHDETKVPPENETGRRRSAIVGAAVAVFIVACAAAGLLYNGKAPDGTPGSPSTSTPAK